MPEATAARAGAALLFALAAADLAVAAFGGGAPYLQTGAPATLLGAAARAGTACILAYALFTGRTLVRDYGWVIAFGLVAVWAPRPVWMYTARHPELDPWAPVIASLVHVVAIAVFAGELLRSAAGPPRHLERFWARQRRGGIVARLAVVAPLGGYMLQAKLAFGEWGDRGRMLLMALGLVWWAVLVATFVLGIAALARRARTAPGGRWKGNARAVLWALAAALVVYLAVRFLAGDLDTWAAHLVSDFRLPYGPFSLFAVRASAADTAGTVGFSCALLAFAGLLAFERRRAPNAPG